MSVGLRHGLLSNVWRWVLVAISLTLGRGVAAQPAAAAPVVGEQGVPTVELSTDEVEPDDLIDVTISGFSSRTVTVTVCGNGALRGSGDCNMAASESTRTNEDGSPRIVELIMSAPPVPCPCLIRVSSPTNDEAAVAPIMLTGHPIAEPVPGAETDIPLVVSIRADRAGAGLADAIRASLGGPTTYDVTITIRNTATEGANGLSVAASASRRQGRLLAALDVSPRGGIAAGGTWEQTVQAELPAPVWGDVRWSADVSNGDNTMTAIDDTSSLPLLLLASIGVLLLVALALSVRLVIRVRTRRRASRLSDGSRADVWTAGTGTHNVADEIDPDASADGAWVDVRKYESV